MHCCTLLATQREILLTKKQPYYSNAQRLSFNRAVRRAVVDTTSVSHVHNVYHLNRRIEVRHCQKAQLLIQVAS